MGFAQGAEADLMLCVGSSLRVNPAASMAKTTAEKGRNLVIINLMKTPLDASATLVINGRCQEVFELLMKKLSFSIPEWKIKRSVKVSIEDSDSDGVQHLKIAGVDTNDKPYDFIKAAYFNTVALPNKYVALKPDE